MAFSPASLKDRIPLYGQYAVHYIAWQRARPPTDYVPKAKGERNSIVRASDKPHSLLDCVRLHSHSNSLSRHAEGPVSEYLSKAVFRDSNSEYYRIAHIL